MLQKPSCPVMRFIFKVPEKRLQSSSFPDFSHPIATLRKKNVGAAISDVPNSADAFAKNKIKINI